MGFFSSSSKKIKFNDLDKILREIRILDEAERQFVKGYFARNRTYGIGKMDVEKAYHDFKYGQADSISEEEAELIKDALMKRLM